jgi:hypothetical protein
VRHEEFTFGKGPKDKRRRQGFHDKVKGSTKIPHVLINGIEHKSCAGCGSLKPLDQFWTNKHHGDGKYSRCRECCTK